MITFTRFAQTSLFTVASGTGDPGYFAYFSSAAAPTVDTIDINQSWSDYTGFYIFLKDAPAEGSTESLATALSRYFDDNYPDPQYTGFAWLEYNSATNTVAKGTVLSTLPPGVEVLLASDTSFRFANYTLPLKQHAPVLPVKDADHNIIAFTCSYPDYAGSPAPRQAYNIQIPLTGQARGTLLGQVSLGDLSANASTGWNAAIYYVVNYNREMVAQRFPLFETGGSDGLQILFDYRLDPVDPLNIDRSYLAFTGTMFYLKKNGEGQWSIELAEATALPGFFRTISGRPVDLVPLPGSDHPPKLVFEELPPVDGEPRYYLSPSGDFELVLRDNPLPAEVTADFLLCGLSGAEAIRFFARSAQVPGSVLRFVARQNAYAPVFPLVSPVLTAGAGSARIAAGAMAGFHRARHAYLESGRLAATVPALLDGTYKTSWINIRPYPETPEGEDLADKAPVYYSQPDNAALYSHDKMIVDVSDTLLQLTNTPAAFFPAKVTQPIPMVAYAGVQAQPAFPYTELQAFEKQVMVATRRETVSSIGLEQQGGSASRTQEPMILTTTPQGLLATVPESGLNWQSVLLAKSESKGTTYNLEFTNGVTRELRDVMQSNQLFLVATESDPLGGANFLNRITIADWPFTLNVGKGSSQGQFGNVLIFKFAEGSLEERVKDPKSWSGAPIFNQNPTLVSKWITAYIEAARLLAASDARYADFLRIVSDPLWSGILALKVDISTQSFPDDLKGLLAGINRDEFFAHHFGIEINFIQPDSAGKLSLPKSSLFALINYVDKDYRTQQDINDHLSGNQFGFFVQQVESPVSTPSGTQELYDFRVLTLQVVFGNSEIKDFASKIQLTTTAWFNEAAELQVSNMGNSLRSQTIEFNGSYEKHNDVNTYTFVTQPDQTYKFLLQSQTLNYVEIVKAQFYTIKDESLQQSGNPGTGTELVYSRFVFWGYMNFRQNESFDLFSFGDLEANPKKSFRTGLYFANLYIGMSFALDNATGEALDRAFTFDPGRMSFDISQSTPRTNSLFTNFPLNLSGLIYSRQDDEAKPSDLGYLPVLIQSPTPVKGQSLSEKWYALLYTLNLGSMGALAAKAGFVSQVATAWSPDDETKRITTGLKLPGVGGQKTLSLQSVLSLNIQSFTFQSAYENEKKEKLSYTLKLNNVKLSLLGMKLPGAADTQFLLFGDAEGKDKTTLAWYAAYFAKPPKTQP